ncbi:hypothetical protein [Actinomadura xylanilytica]|uniref:hypothetical protein n=1 Tax=Actinomadura xylanilytica TaxID=887459 RepID=UPI00255A76A4|nr:hypothetical protein [Actinomadura xylanilytica]MDL4775422.1 hypothetical protein [Actinomadura xylanilytica]
MRLTRTRLIALTGGLAAIAAVGGTAALADGPAANIVVRPAAAAAPGTGSAVKPDLRRVSAQGQAGTQGTKHLEVKCPSGFRAISGSAAATGQPAGSVVRTENRPFHTSSGDGYATTWQALPDAEGATWSIRATATCVQGLAGVQLVTGEESDPSNSLPSTAVCPAGSVVMGIGSKVTTTGNPWDFHYFIRGEGLKEGNRTVYTRAGLSNESPVAGSMTSTAVCAEATEYWSANFGSSDMSKTLTKSVTARCVEGTRAYSAAADTESETWPNTARLEDVTAADGGGRALAKVGMEGNERPDYPWQLNVTAICAR